MKLAYTLLTALTVVTLQAADRPNILFLFSDDHAVKAISAYGGPLAKVAPTPHIDQLAKEGAVFLNSFCANSICGPSRATILTGKHSHKNGFMRNGNKFNPDQWTVAKELQKGGYHTAVIGKWHLNTTPQGFDHWEVLPGQGSYYNPVFIQQDNSRKRFEGYATDITTDKAIAWLENRNRVCSRRAQLSRSRIYRHVCCHQGKCQNDRCGTGERRRAGTDRRFLRWLHHGSVCCLPWSAGPRFTLLVLRW